ncbi:hypothetical protein [Microbacterium sp. Yaish 1]|uniref:hypothetical protein n=1 Tax=Microbacterium sp. Yaish 1 TaxID=2025014 RepID=UPI0015C58AB8|nr:hypothetical protein [Microbacterium sp. Yaish 1]
MRRLTIAHEPAPTDPGAFLDPSGAGYRISGDGTGLDQIATYAREVAAETGDPVVFFEIFWPWETEQTQSWDAVRVDTTKIDAADPADWWIETLPPYAALSDEQREALGIEV